MGILLTSFFLGAVTVPAQSLAIEQAQGEQLIQHLHLAELMGPLAPIALSPYFGLTCLSGAAILSAHDLLPENALLAANPVLQQPLVFGVLLGLSILTSLPRLTKVSKSLAQMIDPLETYSGIIAYLLVIFLAGDTGDSEAVAAGIGGSSLAGLLYLAVILNIIVVNTVRFFFETLILLSPIPVVDAIFEAANKAVVLALMALYAISPFLAFALNAVIFIVCLVLFRRMYRQTVYFRYVLFGLFVKTGSTGAIAEGLSIFPKNVSGAFKPFQHARLHRDSSGWHIHAQGTSRPLRTPLCIVPGLLTHTLQAGNDTFAITRRHDPVLASLAEELGSELGESGGAFGSLRSLFTAENRQHLADS